VRGCTGGNQRGAHPMQTYIMRFVSSPTDPNSESCSWCHWTSCARGPVADHLVIACSLRWPQTKKRIAYIKKGGPVPQNDESKPCELDKVAYASYFIDNTQN
jgi:hypothetical protein